MKKILILPMAILLTLVILSGCITGRSTIEEDISRQNVAGYLYTTQVRARTKSERLSIKARAEAVDCYADTIQKTAKSLFKLESTIEDFEDNLIKFIGLCDPADSNAGANLRETADFIAAHRVTALSHETELENYRKARPADPASEAVVLSYFSDSTCSLLKIQNSYMQTIKDHMYRVHGILEKTSERNARRLLETSISIYDRKILPALEDVFVNFEKASEIHSYLVSGDYMMNRFYLESAKSAIGNAGGGADDGFSSELASAIGEYEGSLSEPPVMKDEPQESISGLFRISKHVHAMDEDAFFLSAVAANFYSEAKRIFKDRNYSPFPSPSPLPVDNTSSPEAVEYSADAAYNIEISEANARKRAQAISKIDAGLTAFKLAGMFMDTDEKYYTILSQVTNLIANGGNMLSDEKRLQALTVIKDNIDSLIGGDREQFVDKITSLSADKIYDTFTGWKKNIKNLEDHDFTPADMKSLLADYGIAVRDMPDETETPDQATGTPSGIKYAYPSPEDYAYPQIMRTYDELKNIDLSSGNDAILSTIIGWSDPLDYSTLDKQTTSIGGITREYYIYGGGSGSEKTRIGWDIEYRTEAVFYTYHFPEEMDRYMKIIRDVSSGSDRFVSLEIDDSDLSRHVAIMFNNPGEAKKIYFISESTNNKKDGLNASQHSVGETYSYWEKGLELFSRTYTSEGILVYFKQYGYENDKVYEDLWTYYDDGTPKSEQHLVDGKYEGPYIIYAESGNMKTSANYLNGMKEGEYADYYDSGRLWRIRTYIEDQLYGDYERYYDNDANSLSVSGYYVNGKKNGTWLEFDEEGAPESEIEYLNDVLDGTYVVHGNRYGQYENGELQGVWYYGKSPDDWSEMVSYDKGVKIWSQYHDSPTRTYYNPDGSVNRRENVGD